MTYYAVFMRKIGEERYAKIGQKKFNPEDKEISFDTGTYRIILQYYNFSTDKDKYYFYDMDTKEILSFDKFKNEKDKSTPEDLDMVANRHVIRQIVAGLKDFTGSNPWIFLVFGLMIGLFAGIFISNTFMPVKIPVYINSTTGLPMV